MVNLQFSSTPHNHHHSLGTAQTLDGLPGLDDAAALRLEFDIESDYDEVDYLPTVMGSLS